MAALLVFIMARAIIGSYYGSDNGYFLAEKYCWTQKVYLVVTFPKIGIDIKRGEQSILRRKTT